MKFLRNIPILYVINGCLKRETTRNDGSPLTLKECKYISDYLTNEKDVNPKPCVDGEAKTMIEKINNLMNDNPEENYKTVLDLLNDNPDNATIKRVLGEYICNGYGCKKDVKKGIDLIVEAAINEEAEAQYLLGELYYDGMFRNGVDPFELQQVYGKRIQSRGLSAFWKYRAAINGDKEDQYKYPDNCKSGKFDCYVFNEDLLNLMKLSAFQGHKGAIHQVLNLYFDSQSEFYNVEEGQEFGKALYYSTDDYYVRTRVEDILREFKHAECEDNANIDNFEINEMPISEETDENPKKDVVSETKIHTTTEIKLVSVSDLKGKEFFIPDYQRGYRWEEEQVDSLLKDLFEFYNDRYKENKQGKEIYCIQPLVIQRDNKRWNVIDGQQRLTTLFVVLKCFANENWYSIEYQTRKNSSSFLESLSSSTADSESTKNADFYHMHKAYKIIEQWKKGIDDEISKEFINMLKERVNFIWYELDENESPIKVFKRLNIGKISLTESELIKALFLNRNNFSKESGEKEKLISLVEISNEWDEIEYRLQDDRFWLFFHDKEYNCSTRIDFILSLVKDVDCDPNKYTNMSYPVFSYFYDELQNSKNKQEKVTYLWNKIYEIFETLEEWYNNETIYHYIGYISIINGQESIKKTIINYSQNKDNKYKNYENKERFIVEKLEKDIKDSLKKCYDLNLEYETKEQRIDKRAAKPLLLLHNVQTIIDQNESIKKENKYDLPDFVRFPFHLFKKENWDVEHIRPNNSQDLEYFIKDRRKGERAKYIYILKQSSKSKEINDLILNYETTLKNGISKDEEEFEKMWIELDALSNKEELQEDQKNKIWNYVLLDSSTNREYGNSCFSIKRDYVLKKEKGIKPKITYDENTGVNIQEIREAAFVPICTRKVFSKSYTQYPDDLSSWSEKDAAYYRMDIEKTLKKFLYDEERIKTICSNTKYEEAFDSLFKQFVKENIFTYCDYKKTFLQYLKEKGYQKTKNGETKNGSK